MDELNIEAFGEIIEQYLTENEVNMLITLPKGSLDVQIRENIELGGVIRFYIFIRCIKPMIDEVAKEVGANKKSKEWAGVVNGLLAMIKEEMLEGGTDE